MPYAAHSMDDLTFDAAPLPRFAMRKRMPRYPLDILLVEDDPSDAMLTEVSLDQVNVDYELHTLENGADVLPYLRRQGRYADERRPDVILLDLSLPAKDGFEVLTDMATHSDRFGTMPIVILTGDASSTFLKTSYGLNIAAYVVKPCSAEKIEDVLAMISRNIR